jgi:outer membrane lipoprotein-sorting protein
MNNTLIDSIQLVISDGKFPVKRLIFSDSYGNRTDIIIEEVKVNIPLPASLFHFSPPEGTAIIRQ